MHRSGTRRRVSRPALAAFAALSGYGGGPLPPQAPASRRADVGPPPQSGAAQPYASVTIGDEVVVARDSRVRAADLPAVEAPTRCGRPSGLSTRWPSRAAGPPATAPAWSSPWSTPACRPRMKT